MSFRKIFILALVSMLAAFGMSAAPASVTEFDKVPEPALATLKVAKGKVISTGMVFVNGKLLKGPYVVSRYGTAIRVNRDQVTGQIVPWIQFTTAAGTKPPPPKPVAAAPQPAPAPPPSSSSVDDLFDDDPQPAKPQAAAAPPIQQVSAPPPVPAGDYVDTPRSKNLLKRINDYRTDIDRTLRNNGVFIFSVRHSPIRLEARMAKELMAVLPDALRDANDARQLYEMLRRKGITYIPAAACVDLMRDRALYIAIRDRLREIKEEQSFRKMLDSTGTGR